MSFSNEVKNELSRIDIEKKCCQLAEIAGFLRISGSLRLAGGGKFKILISTDNPAVARHYKKLIKAYFNVETSLEIGEGDNLHKGYRYNITINPDQRSEQILRETGILLVREGNNYISDGIYTDIIRSKCCKKSYLRGLFLGCGSVNNPEKSYHLEFLCNSKTLALDLKKLANSFENINGKVAKRRNHYIVYFKSSSNVADILGIIGAHDHYLQIQDTLIKKSILSSAVRITNCDNANTDRTLDASERQIKAIKTIFEKKGEESLSPKLREIAVLRLAHPEASLTQIGEMLDPPLKKSGVNNRFKKIMEIFDKIV